MDITKQVTFNKSAIYQFHDEDQYDINKLFGLSYGMHHTNSTRFGWRSLGVYSSMIEIVAYCYVDGKRVEEDGTNLYIGMVDINKPYTFHITVTDEDYNFSIIDFTGDDFKVVGSKTITHNGIPKLGYHLYPYFGGNRAAPHNITINIH
jgi:hypothetical protein